MISLSNEIIEKKVEDNTQVTETQETSRDSRNQQHSRILHSHQDPDVPKHG